MSDAIDIRASFCRFPGWSQHFWTWVTGKALPGQQPLMRHTWYSYLFATLLAFFAGLSLSVASLSIDFRFWYLALLGGWVISLSAARSMILVIAHQCIHRRFSGSRQIDAFVGELVTLLTVYQDAAAFEAEHFAAHHRAAVFGTKDDPPVQVLLRLGFHPGMSCRQLWQRTVIVLVSPAFYLQGFADRLRCNLLVRGWRRVVFLGWAGFWISLPFWHPNGGCVLLVAFVFPIVLLAQASALLDKLGEHAWLTARDARLGLRYYHVTATWARFCGCAVPDRSLLSLAGIGAWLRWSCCMLLYHIPVRMLVVVGDLPNHDFHHRYPRNRDWMIAAYARQRDIDAGLRGGPPYSEIWGLGQAIGRMFQGLSVARAIFHSAHEGTTHASMDH